MEKKMTDKNQIIKEIRAGETSLGIEFGSTRIKAVLVGKEHAPIASGSYEWENQLVDGIWTYSLEDIWKGLQTSYQELAKDVKKKGENAKVAIRNIRRDANDSFKKLAKEEDVSEDEIKQLEDQAQKMTDKYIADVDRAVEAKTKEILTV